MAGTTDPVGEHLRVMEERIKAQRVLVDTLKQGEEDASQASWRLRLLLSALEEMRFQLAQLAETEADKKNGRTNIAAMMRLLGKRVA